MRWYKASSGLAAIVRKNAAWSLSRTAAQSSRSNSLRGKDMESMLNSDKVSHMLPMI